MPFKKYKDTETAETGGFGPGEIEIEGQPGGETFLSIQKPLLAD